MKITVIDQSTNKSIHDQSTDKRHFEVEHAPRTGECIMATSITTGKAVATNRYFRVKDVMCMLDNSDCAAILVEELQTPPQWMPQNW